MSNREFSILEYIYVGNKHIVSISKFSYPNVIRLALTLNDNYQIEKTSWMTKDTDAVSEEVKRPACLDGCKGQRRKFFLLQAFVFNKEREASFFKSFNAKPLKRIISLFIRTLRMVIRFSLVY